MKNSVAVPVDNLVLEDTFVKISNGEWQPIYDLIPLPEPIDPVKVVGCAKIESAKQAI